MNSKDNMMNRLVIFFIVMLLGLTSCGINKQVMSQEVQTDTSSHSRDSMSLSKDMEGMIKATVEEMLNRDVSVSIIAERTVWSPPDTAGRQHKLQEEKITTSAAATESHLKTNTSVGEVAEQIDSTSISASDEDLVVMETSAEMIEKSSLPWWQKTLMIVGAAAIIYMIIRIALKLYARKGTT